VGADEPVEPDAILPADTPLDLGIVRDPTLNRPDHSWIEAMGFEVTRESPPVGSVAAGFVGVGFDLMVPDEYGHLQLTEAYDAEGHRVDRSVISGREAPPQALQAKGNKGRGPEEATESRG
jgi:hypothetical protein